MEKPIDFLGTKKCAEIIDSHGQRVKKARLKLMRAVIVFILKLAALFGASWVIIYNLGWPVFGAVMVIIWLYDLENVKKFHGDDK